MKNCIVYKLYEVNCNQTKSTPKNLLKCDFWMYSVNLGVLIRQGDSDVTTIEFSGIPFDTA